MKRWRTDTADPLPGMLTRLLRYPITAVNVLGLVPIGLSKRI